MLELLGTCMSRAHRISVLYYCLLFALLFLEKGGNAFVEHIIDR